MAVNIGPRIGIEGESEYRKQINNIIQQAKTLASEMQVVTSAFGKNTTAQEKATATGKVLEKQIDVQRERVAALGEMLVKSAKETGDTSTQTLKWKQAVNEATAELHRMEKQLDESADSTDDLGDEMEKAEKSTFSFGDALKSNILAQAIVDGIKNLASAFKDLAGDMIESAADVKAEASQFEQTFGSMAAEASAAIRQVADEGGILQTRLNSVGAGIYAFARSSGGEAAESLDIMQRALQASADAAAYYDRSLEETSDQLLSFLKGNYANDAALGLSATEATRNAAAMKLFGQEFSKLSEIQKQQTLLQMVLDAQQLSGAMGQAAREAEGWENVQGNLNESIRQLQAHAGEPFLAALVPIVQQLTSEITEMTQNTDWDAFGKSVGNFITTMVKNGPLIVSLVAGIGAGFVTWNVASMITGVITAVKEFRAANEGATVSQALFNAVLKANPLVLVISLIASLVTALITLYNTNEEFRNKVNSAWQSIKDTIFGVGDSIQKFFTDLHFKAIGWARDMMQGFADGIRQAYQNVVNAVKGIGEKISSFLHFSRPDTGPLRNYESWMPDMMRGLAGGIRQNAWRVQGALDDATGGWSIPAPLVPAIGFAGAAGGGYGGAGSTTNLGGITMHIYGAEGQDVNELAEIVMDKIETKVQQIGGTWA